MSLFVRRPIFGFEAGVGWVAAAYKWVVAGPWWRVSVVCWVWLLWAVALGGDQFVGRPPSYLFLWFFY
jgi:hypothetical protein